MRESTANERLVMLSGGLILAAGVNRFESPLRVQSDLVAGLKVVVLLSGRLQINIGESGDQEVCGPVALVIRSQANTRRDQLFTPGIPVRYALVQMTESICGSQIAAALDKRGAGDASMLLSCSAGHALQSLANQIMNCPIRGPERELFLCGKALQMASLAVSNCVSSADAKDEASFSSRDVEKVKHARDLLIASLQKPPSLEVLAQRSGLNVRKLNAGFRRVFGATVFGFLQEYRMEVAYKLIASGEMNVSEVAYRVGYGAAHFATAFRKRFGISPSDLR